MQQRGRKSTASLAIAGVVTTVTRIAPPRDLSDVQRAIWLATVNSKPAEWFGDEHVPMLVEYVRHIETANALTHQIEAFDPEWLKDDDGLKRYDKLTKMRAREAGVINTLARSMRLTQQAVYRADRAGTLSKNGGGRKPWQAGS